jgi:tetratricopeptide (TPR) repeat protein
MRKGLLVFSLFAGFALAQPEEVAVPVIIDEQEVIEVSEAVAQLADELLIAQAQAAPPRPPVAPKPGKQGPKPVPLPPAPALYADVPGLKRTAPEEALYRQAGRFLDRREWDKAIELYDAVIEKKGSKVDSALYWKAYALRKSGRQQPALDTLAELERTYPNSRWLNDAKALAIEVRQAMGKPVSPDEESDEELKLMAIHALAQSDPQRAIPLLEKIILGSSSPKLREQALFVLAQSDQPRAKEILLRVAKGGANPDLQLHAIQFLGVRKDAGPELASLYNANLDRDAKRRIIHMLGSRSDVKPLIDIARAEKDPEIKREAIRMLAASNTKEANDLLVEILEK